MMLVFELALLGAARVQPQVRHLPADAGSRDDLQEPGAAAGLMVRWYGPSRAWRRCLL